MEDIQLHLSLAPGLEFSVHSKQQKPSVISPRYADESWITYIPPAEHNPRPVCGWCHRHFSYPDGSGPVFTPCCFSLQLVPLLPTIDYPLTWPAHRNLNDGISVRWTQATLSREPQWIITNAFTSQSWGLLHHPGTFSPLHQDSQGCITLVDTCSGTKFWGFVKLDESALATSQTVTKVVQKLSDINE